jgi:hypothetical protein
MVNIPPITPKNIYQRINAVMQEVDYIQKGEKKVAGQYRFVSHDQVTAALHTPMTKHGIACTSSIVEMKQDGNRTEVKLEVTFVNIDQPSDRFSVIYWGYGIDSSDKGIGKAVSYGFKYALLKTFCLETGDDPDQDQDVQYQPPKPKAASMTNEEYFEYAESFGDDTTKFLGYVDFVKEAKKCTALEAAALCKKGGENTVKAFEKWKEKQK